MIYLTLITRLRRIPDFDGCGYADGKLIFAWIKPPKPDAPLAKNTKIMVNTRERFEGFCEKTLKCNSSAFIGD